MYFGGTICHMTILLYKKKIILMGDYKYNFIWRQKPASWIHLEAMLNVGLNRKKYTVDSKTRITI